jgi:hypothetical protein
MATLNLQMAANTDSGKGGTTPMGTTTPADWSPLAEAYYNQYPGSCYFYSRFYLNIPNGATVSSATYQVYCYSASLSQYNNYKAGGRQYLYNNNLSTAQGYNTYSFNWGSSSPANSWITFTVTSQVNAAVNSGGWSSGDYVVFKNYAISQYSNGVNHSRVLIRLWNNSFLSTRPKLNVTYTEPSVDVTATPTTVTSTITAQAATVATELNSNTVWLGADF